MDISSDYGYYPLIITPSHHIYHKIDNIYMKLVIIELTTETSTKPTPEPPTINHIETGPGPTAGIPTEPTPEPPTESKEPTSFPLEETATKQTTETGTET